MSDKVVVLALSAVLADLTTVLDELLLLDEGELNIVEVTWDTLGTVFVDILNILGNIGLKSCEKKAFCKNTGIIITAIQMPKDSRA